MYRKQMMVVVLLCVGITICSIAFNGKDTNNNDGDEPVTILPSVQRTGDSAKGYEYLTTGDFIKSGIPYSYYKLYNFPDTNNYLRREGKNAIVPYDYNVVKSHNQTVVVVPTCLQCHGQVFEKNL